MSSFINYIIFYDFILLNYYIFINSCNVIIETSISGQIQAGFDALRDPVWTIVVQTIYVVIIFLR